VYNAYAKIYFIADRLSRNSAVTKICHNSSGIFKNTLHCVCVPGKKESTVCHEKLQQI